jgi:1,4-alpha-glucan branching enzyme
MVIRLLLAIAILKASFFAVAQTNPTISPAFFSPSDQISVTYDVTGTALSALPTAYAWVWIPSTSINAKWNVNPASNDASKTDNAKFTKSIVNGRTYFTITFVPSSFFDASISSQPRMGILLKGNDWSNGQTADYLVNFWDGNFELRLKTPAQQPIFVENGEQLAIAAQTPVAADFNLYINDILTNQASGITSYAYNHTISETSGFAEVKLVATSGVNAKEVTFQYILGGNSPILSKPTTIIPGINYSGNDATKVTLCLLAPGKSSVYALGDFSNWNVSTEYIMNRDGEFFWIELTGLTAGKEYAYQYLVNETITISDPYADKILDPDDQYIPEASYPNLKSFPTKALKSEWYKNRVSVFQTSQQPYVWQATNFQKPAKEKLVVYELLIRDFFDDEHRNYQSLIDTISYFKRLGISAIQLMPIMEFNGNEGWGYNPTFMFAPDKYYGTKNKLKEFVDVCHENGIAVILDIALNHQDVPNSFLSMYFDFGQLKPMGNNPWFNVTPKHPFNVFFDMNHESSYTKKYLDTINYYWLNEYKVDGFRFDLSKGFTQRNNPTDVGAWSAYDASRIALLKRMADKIWFHTPDAYVVLEHLSDNSEEKELAEYRASEGKGMMLWGKMTDQYNQNTMGYASNSSLSSVYHKTRTWSSPRLVGYMESHDEERLMFKNITFGNTTEAYDVKNIDTGLQRIQAAFAMFLTVPGPKMIWQFGELGYDQSINLCSDGSISEDCRLTPKPLPWDYLENEVRYSLFERVSDLLRLRNDYDVFSTGDAAFSEGPSLVKSLSIKNSPYTAAPSDSSEMNVQVVANFDVVRQTAAINFPHTGIWYNYVNGGGALEVTTLPYTLTLEPGSYLFFTDVPIEITIITDVLNEVRQEFSAYPNPTKGFVKVETDMPILQLSVYDLSGRATQISFSKENEITIEGAPGLYILKIETSEGVITRKVMKQ